MADLLTLAEAKAALRIESDDYDTTLTRMIASVSSRIWRYLKLDPAAYETSGGDLDTEATPPEAITAAEFLLASYFRNPDAWEAHQLPAGELPWQVQSILGELRDPTLA